MERKCYEFFKCSREGCPMLDPEETRNCWDVNETLNHCMNGKDIQAGGSNKKDFCMTDCLYYKYRIKQDN
ncbi:MAG: hypothetical protein KJ950_05910 [Proteobacteria bacterium]|nr:hypothetical protein [Pseudomonadota bacterium]MBU1685746.1 hypothetical protein [Pseudomonadota bacterium]